MQDVTVLRDFDEFISESQQLGIMIKSYSDVGSIPAPGGKITFTARELVSLDSRNASYDVLISVERANQHPLSGVASIPYDDIDRFVVGARTLTQGGIRGLSRMKNFEASIASTDGSLRFVVFNSANGSIMSLIEASGCALYFSDIAKLNAASECLIKAKQEIDQLKIY